MTISSAVSKSLTGNLSTLSGMTSDQNKMLGMLDGPEKARMKLQFEMQNKAELISTLTNIMKKQHDAMQQINGNLR